MGGGSIGGTGGMGGGDIVTRMAEAEVLVLSKSRGVMEKPFGGGIGGGTGGLGGGGDNGPLGNKLSLSSQSGEGLRTSLAELPDENVSS